MTIVSRFPEHSDSIGRSSITEQKYPSLHPIVFANSCYYDIKRVNEMADVVSPHTLIEFMMICNTLGMIGMSDVQY